jgi:hypothetical protein
LIDHRGFLLVAQPAVCGTPPPGFFTSFISEPKYA